MSHELNDFKISNLSTQIERLVHAVDKVCDRVELLERDSFERKIHRKLIGFLYTIYPAIMMVLLMLNGSDKNKISDTYNQTKDLAEKISSVLVE